MSRIAEVRPFMVGFEQATGGRGNMLIVRIRTDDGLEGFGEGSLPHKTRAVAGAVEDFAEYLVGQDDSLIERHWQVLYRNSFQRGGVILMTAQSAIDQALWDIAGKRLGLPVWRLMGGAVRDRILLYTHPAAPVERRSSTARTNASRRATAPSKPGFRERRSGSATAKKCGKPTRGLPPSARSLATT